MTIKFSDITGGGIPYGNNAGRPANPGIGKLYSNGEEKRLELYTSAGWQNIVSETPGVVSVSGNYLESVGSATFEITGTNFTTGAIASAIGTNGVEINANSTTVNSIVSITASFSGLSSAYEPYDLKVTNTSNLFGLLPDALYINNILSWTTPSGSLGSFNEKVSISVSATATDESAITYSLAQGSSLPTGLTLNSSTGLISGTLPDISSTTTYTFTINASDGANPAVPRAFSITSNLVDLYEFTSHTFTNAGVTGSSGPTLSQVRSAYSSQSWAQDASYLNMVSQGIQKWTVPATGNYRITASGAGGGGTTSGVGSGALIQDTFSLTVGEVIDIAVGQTGGATAGATGGGGGTYVIRAPYNTNGSILVIAGGGGGTEGTSSLQASSNGQITTSGANGAPNANGTDTAGFGGSSGNGGGTASLENAGGGGGGFFTNGARNNNWNNNGGSAFVNGSVGATATAPACFGGFGGGGAASGNGGGGGAAGGGGYSGGGGGDNAGNTVGGGGGSYFANGLNINRVTTAGGGSGGNTAGYVTILKV